MSAEQMVGHVVFLRTPGSRNEGPSWPVVAFDKDTGFFTVGLGQQQMPVGYDTLRAWLREGVIGVV